MAGLIDQERKSGAGQEEPTGVSTETVLVYRTGAQSFETRKISENKGTEDGYTLDMQNLVAALHGEKPHVGPQPGGPVRINRYLKRAA